MGGRWSVNSLRFTFRSFIPDTWVPRRAIVQRNSIPAALQAMLEVGERTVAADCLRARLSLPLTQPVTRFAVQQRYVSKVPFGRRMWIECGLKRRKF